MIRNLAPERLIQNGMPNTRMEIAISKGLWEILDDQKGIVDQ